VLTSTWAFCQVAGVKVADCHRGLELLTPSEVGTRCETGIKHPALQINLRNVGIRLTNLCSFVSVRDSDTWVVGFFDLLSARVFDG